MTLGYSTPRISALSQIKMKKRKNALIKVRSMVMKSFDHLLNECNSLSTMLRRIKKTHIFNEDVHMINFFYLVWRGLIGRRRPPRPSCYVKYNNVLLPADVVRFNIGHLCLLCRFHRGSALLGK